MSYSTQLKLTLAIAFAGVAPAVAAQDFTSGLISYEIVSEEELTVAITEGDDYYEGLTTADLPAQVVNDGKTYTVVAIADYGLNGATFAEDIVLPSTITSIGEYGLSECEGTVVTLPAGLEEYDPTAFVACLIDGFAIDDSNECLTAVDGVLLTKDKKTIVCYPAMREGETYEVPEYVSAIGERAFQGGDEYLEEVVFHGGMTIGDFAFKDNGNILRIDLPGDIALGQGAFTGCEAVTELILGEGIREIPVNCFFDLCGLPALTLPESLEKINRNGFGFCEELEAVSFPANLVWVDENGFADCGKLATVDFGKVQTLGKNAFARTGITAANLPEVKDLGEFAFAQCAALTTVSCPAAVTIGASAFYRCTALSEVTIGDKTETLGNTLFYECPAIGSVAIPASVTSIGNGILTGTSSLTEVTVAAENAAYRAVGNIIYTADMTTVMAAPGGIADWNVVLPEGVTTVNAMAFRKCANLKSILLPSTVTELGNIAFGDCTGLAEVISLNPVPPTGCAFPDAVYADATLYVADEDAREAYKAAEGWQNFVNAAIYEADGIRSIADEESCVIEYYDMNGRKVMNPSDGIYIERRVYPTGSVTITKTVR